MFKSAYLFGNDKRMGVSTTFSGVLRDLFSQIVLQNIMFQISTTIMLLYDTRIAVYNVSV